MAKEATNWFEIWFQDKESMLETMVRNMTADLNAGYNYFGNCIKQQRETINEYRNQFDHQMDEFKLMDDAKVNRWCYYDLKKRGVIA